MDRTFRIATWLRWTPGLGLLLINGCLAAAERGIDVLLAPQASGNLAAASFGALAGIMTLLSQLTRTG